MAAPPGHSQRAQPRYRAVITMPATFTRREAASCRPARCFLPSAQSFQLSARRRRQCRPRKACHALRRQVIILFRGGRATTLIYYAYRYFLSYIFHGRRHTRVEGRFIGLEGEYSPIHIAGRQAAAAGDITMPTRRSISRAAEERHARNITPCHLFDISLSADIFESADVLGQLRAA